MFYKSFKCSARIIVATLSLLIILSFSQGYAEADSLTGYQNDLFYDEGALANWWCNDGHDWYFFQNGKKHTGFAEDANGKHYFKDGWYITGYVGDIFYEEGLPCNWWCDDGSAWYFFQNGKKHTGFAEDASGERYFVNGKYANGWVIIGSTKQYFVNGIHATSGQNPMKLRSDVYTKTETPLTFIDLSRHNGVINFNKLKSQADGVILRMSYGDFTYDSKFITNLAGLKAFHIPYGIYHYSYALTIDDAEMEAREVIAALKANNVNPAYPIYFDMEDADHYKERNGLTIQKNAPLFRDMCVVFCEHLKAEGYQAGIYASKSWFDRMGDLSDYHIWLAHWGASYPTIPYAGLWQYTDKGVGNDFGASSTYVDVNKVYFTPRQNNE